MLNIPIIDFNYILIFVIILIFIKINNLESNIINYILL